MGDIFDFDIGFNMGYNQGYQQGKADTIEEYTCQDDCINFNCERCRRYEKLIDYYETRQGIKHD